MNERDRSLLYLNKNLENLKKAFDLEINIYFESKTKEDYVIVEDIVLNKLKIRDYIKDLIFTSLTDHLYSLTKKETQNE